MSAPPNINRARHRVGIGDITPIEAAARLGMELSQFEASLPSLNRRGFPAPDETSGNYGLEAVDKWRLLRDRHLFPELTAAHGSSEPLPFEMRRQRFLDGKKGKTGEAPLPRRA